MEPVYVLKCCHCSSTSVTGKSTMRINTRSIIWKCSKVSQ